MSSPAGSPAGSSAGSPAGSSADSSADSSAGSPWEKMSDFDSLMEHAIQIEDVFALKCLISVGVDVNKYLPVAIKHGCRKSLDILIDNGACNWEIALASAAEHRQIELVDMFLEKGGKIHKSQAVLLNDTVPFIVGHILDKNGVTFTVNSMKNGTR
jgi:hypothetical protein